MMYSTLLKWITVEEAKLKPNDDGNKPVIPAVGNDQLEEMKKKYAAELNFYNFANDRLKENKH